MEPVLTRTVIGSDIAARARIVNRYAMPFAVILVLLGVVLGGPVGNSGYICIALLVCTAVFNIWSPQYIATCPDPSTFIKVRLWINLICNAVLVWILGSVWSPCWLLLALSPLAGGVYGSRSRTVALSLGVSGFLIIRYLVQSHVSPLELGEQVTYCAFVILASLMVADLTRPRGAVPTPLPLGEAKP